MKHQRFLLTSTTLLFLIGFLSVPVASAQKVQVRALLFYSQSCGHCHKVITEVLPFLSEKYGDKLQIAGVDVGHQIGQQLYQSAIERFEIPENRLGVPTLIIGETILVGSLEIPEELPGLIEEGLENGGIDWPDIPGLREIMAEQPVSTQEVQDSEVQGDNQNPEATNLEHSSPKTAVFIDRFKQDPVGNTLSVIILFGMIVTLLVFVIHQ